MEFKPDINFEIGLRINKELNKNLDMELCSYLPYPLQNIIAGYTIDCNDAIYALSISDLSLIQWCHSIIKYDKNKILKDGYTWQDWGTEDKYFNFIKWIYEEFKPSKEELLCEIYVIWYICRRDYLKVISWLHNNFTLDKIDIRSIYNIAGVNDKVDIVKFIKSISNMSITEYIGSKCVTFISRCENGNLKVAKWMANEFKITREKCLLINSMLFNRICKNGHLEVAKWLVSEFQMTKKECVSTSDCPPIYTFEYVCRHGNLEFVKWLVSEFQMTKKECKLGYENAHQNEKKEIMIWLNNKFKYYIKHQR
jgi:hypothetical protein